MVKLQCSDCKKQFLYAAKKVVTTPLVFQLNIATTSAVPEKPLPSQTVETHVCPYCENLNLIEAVEAEASITSVKSVDLGEVDSLLKEGYLVHELYAKTAVLIKKEKKEG